MRKSGDFRCENQKIADQKIGITLCPQPLLKKPWAKTMLCNERSFLLKRSALRNLDGVLVVDNVSGIEDGSLLASVGFGHLFVTDGVEALQTFRALSDAASVSCGAGSVVWGAGVVSTARAHDVDGHPLASPSVVWGHVPAATTSTVAITVVASVKRTVRAVWQATVGSRAIARSASGPGATAASVTSGVWHSGGGGGHVGGGVVIPAGIPSSAISVSRAVTSAVSNAGIASTAPVTAAPRIVTAPGSAEAGTSFGVAGIG
jgi:hypothetical protein